MRSAIALLTLAFASIGFAAPIGLEDTPSSTVLPTFQTCNRPGVFALTFDDGPYEYTWDLAQMLNSRGIKATFFTNGHNFVTTDLNTTTTPTRDGSKTYVEVLQMLDQLGHEVGSHTYEHSVLVGRTREQIEYQMNEQSDLIFDAIGKRVALMRPPEGATDDASDQILHELGYSNILWDIDPLDYNGSSVDEQFRLVTSVVDEDVAGETLGHISLQHDVHPSSVRDLTPRVIDYIRGKNYTFVTISECLGINAYKS
ncbi:hypothetical protein MFLAVUS_005868 [Mucor flavus]|uniref:NodB homology domain-containing protein n=1 Tax=Mucor flavus TaxID=439312 RepID=A0ABP9YZY3_9FUNG